MIVSPTSTTSNSAYTEGAVRVPKKSLGQQDFLKLISVQLAKQDPMKPMEDTSFIAQMAQFSSLEQSSQMAKDMASLRSQVSLQSASGMIGRDVSIATKNGNVSGTVNSVESYGGDVKVGVGGLFYSLSNVVRVAPGATGTTP